MSDCIFCKIINGDFNTEFVLENDYAVLFANLLNTYGITDEHFDYDYDGQNITNIRFLLT